MLTIRLKRNDPKKMNISIIMAVYNGSAYIQRQLSTILENIDNLSQLNVAFTCQLVLVDDQSADESISMTLSILAKRRDIELVLMRNQYNIGPFLSFFEGLKKATGDIIFLSDQDDEWKRRKIENVLASFRSAAEPDLVCHACVARDEKGSVTHLSPVQKRGELFALGCCLAFKADRLKDLVKRYEWLCNRLGYPIGHDRFICMYFYSLGSVKVIEEKLIVYRLHGQNYSLRRKASRKITRLLGDKIFERAHLYSVFSYSEIKEMRTRGNKVAYNILSLLSCRSHVKLF